MLYVGLGFLVTWLQVQVFGIDIVKALLVTAIVFVILGLVTEGLPNLSKGSWIRRA